MDCVVVARCRLSYRLRADALPHAPSDKLNEAILLIVLVKPEELILAEQIVAVRIEYSEQDARRAAEFFNATGRRRGSLGACMIAAWAREHGAALATTNIQDFKRFGDFGLRLA